MKSVLGCSQSEYRKNTQIRIIICAVVAVAVIVLNVLLSVFRTDGTHIAFMAINIVADIFLLWFLIGYSLIVLCFRRKLYKLATDSAVRENVGEIVYVSEETETYCGFSCYRTDIKTDDGEYAIYTVACGAVKFNNGDNVKLITVNNIVVQAEAV